MDEELTRSYRRWLAADEGGNHDDADAACRALFEGAEQQDVVPLSFVSQTMHAIAASGVRDAERARRTRVALTTGAILAGAVTAYYTAGAAVSFAVRSLVWLFDGLIGLVVTGAAGAETGASVWSVFSGLGRAASAFVADPTVTFVLLVLQALAIAALITLQRLLGSDGESFK
jgi:hypothetical protein